MKTYKITYKQDLCFQDYDNYTSIMSSQTKKFLLFTLFVLIVSVVLFFVLDSDKKITAEAVIFGSSISLIIYIVKYYFEIFHTRRKIKKLAVNLENECEIISINEKMIDATLFGFIMIANWNEIKHATLINGTLFISREKSELPIRFNPSETGPELFDFVFNKVKHVVKES
jgi:hypothetical protein